MFNEAFWFFYWVGVIEYLTAFFTVIAIVSTFTMLITGIAWIIDDEKPAKPWFIGALVVTFLAFTFAMMTPTTTALYAGAGQHVAQTTDVDETLLRLKELVDAKIEEQLPEKE